jgi:alpha-L-fucosidase 2
MFTGSPTDQEMEGGLYYAAHVRVVAEGGTIDGFGERVEVSEANAVTIYISTATNYVACQDQSFKFISDANPEMIVEATTSAAVAAGYEAVKSAHLADYHALSDKTNLLIGDSAEVPTKTTPELLAGYRNGNSAVEDKYLEMLYFKSGRYLLISSSRKDSLPASLQGLWARSLRPARSSDYHCDINLQMNYWPSLMFGLEDPHLAYVEWTKTIAQRGYVVAKHYFCKPDGGDVRGWAFHVECNEWGHAAPGAFWTGFYFPVAAAWCCCDIWSRFEFTQDKAFLEENFQLFLDAALFWVDVLWTDSRDGTLVTNPSYSPEHGPYSLGAMAQQAIIAECFDGVLKAAAVLGKSGHEIAEVEAAKDKLSGPKIGLGGQFQEWKDETTMDVTGDKGHRHINHLSYLHPGSQIVAGRSAAEDKFASAMKMTLRVRGDSGDGSCGWDRAWRANVWARLHDGENAYTMLTHVLSGNTMENLWDSLNAGPPFQIDGGLGMTAGMGEMLLQSHSGTLQLLPALPSAWPSGAISGIFARGNFKVDLQWQGGKLSRAEITSGSGLVCSVKYPGISTFNLSGGTKIVDNADQIHFSTTAGQVYVLTP